ncbi:hypothetical protein VQ02_00480 [Methylobacterium variabile]|uniref:Calcium-binding protein n=1 Tax=Methylobacterium variabile TaxID=298794 RepID=A0A0J6TBT0_9HYPH|nr:FG-GAP-like repeat-containing protein [Methylobacterium variabile]KMO43314.1 hypothetical protein VQ02_00480 [Methylobacterium variabile]
MGNYIGNPGNDTLTGTTADDNFFGSAGNDSIAGGGGTTNGDFIFYGPINGYAGITGPITVTFGPTLYTGTVTKPTGTDTFTGIRGVSGTTAADTLIGTTNTSTNYRFPIQLTGAAGNDTIDGKGLTINIAAYQFSPAGINVNLQTSTSGSDVFGTAQDGYGTTDTLKNVVRVRGSGFDDTIVGSNASDFFDGSLGNDTYDGVGSQTTTNTLAYDTIDFQGGVRSVTVTAGDPVSGLFGGQRASVSKVSLTGGANYTDTLSNISQIRGSDANDTFIGTTAAYSIFGYRFRGEGGNDTFNGQNNTANTVDYTGADNAVAVDLSAGTATGDGNDTLVNVVSVRGSFFNDTLLGSAASDIFSWGDSGLHTVNGRGGANRVAFFGNGAVTIDLGTTATTDGFGGYQGSLTKAAGTETILNVANAQGGNGDDTVYGTPGNNQLSGGPGTNLIDGRDGYDTLAYQFITGLNPPAQGATVNLGDGVNGTATNPWGGTDTLRNIEAVRGSVRDDDLTGATLAGGAYSLIEGYGGNDVLRAPSTDAHVTVTYANSLSGVTVDLGAGVTSDDGWFGGHDTLVNIRSVTGSAFGDRLTGSAGNDLISGGAGDDTLDGGAGDDTIQGGLGTNTLIGGEGTDTALYAIARADATITTQNGVTTVTASGITDTLTGFESVAFTDQTVSLGGTTAPRVSTDLNGDKTSDALFQQGASVVAWQVQNGQVQSSTGLGNAGDYRAVGTGDLNGDGTSDVLFQQGASVVAWQMQNGQVQASNGLGNAGSYQVVGTGDINGDGTSDVLFQQGASVVAWQMQNGQVQSSTGLGNAGDYQVVGTGDLNGDGTDDLVFQQGASVVAWIMGNGQVQSVADLGNAGAYQVAGVGDLNGDGRADLVFQNGASVVDWIMGSNGQVQSANALGDAGGYTVSGVGDYNGDRTADVLFQQGPSVVGWQVQNGQVQSLLNLGNAGDYVAVA